MKELKNKSNEKELLSVKDLRISFYNQGRYFPAVNDANFVVNKGDFFGIVGESGSGKTTIGKSIVRLIVPSSGEINIDGRLISNKKISRENQKWLSENVQMIFQDPSNSMNSIKTVMQTIYEPLAINRSLIKDSIKFVKDVLSIRKFCHYDFSVLQFDLYQRFQMNYLAKQKRMYVELNNKVAPLLNLDNLSSNEMIIILDEILQEFIDEMLDCMGNVHLFVESNKNLVQEQINFRKNGRLSGLDIDLFTALKRLKIEKTYVRFSHEAQKAQHYIKNVKHELKNVKEKFNVTHVRKCAIRFATWNSTIHNNIRNYQSYIKLAQNEFLYTFNFIKLVEWKNILYFYHHLRKMQIYREKQLYNLICLINSKIDSVYNYLSNIVLEEEKNFFEPNVDKRDAFIKLHFLKKLAVATFKLFKHSLIHQTLFSFETFKENLSSKTEYNFSGTQIQEFYKLIASVWGRINYALTLIDTNSKKSANEFLNTINQLNDDLKNKKKELTDLINNRELDEKNQAKAIYSQSKSEVKRIKAERNKDIKDVYMKRWELFLKNKKNVEHNFLNLSAEIFDLSRAFKKTVKAFKINVIKKANSELLQAKKVFNIVNDKSVWQKIKIKMKTIDSFEAEYRSLLGNTVLYRNLFQWKSFLPWLLLKKLINIKKQEKVFKVLKSVGLRSEHAFRYPHEFSGGQKQRIVIARALITHPKIIVADEPTSALDVSVQAQIINWMKDLTKKFGVTFLFIAHDLSVVNYVCNKVIIMHRGRIVEKGNTNEIFNNPIHPYTKSLLAAAPKLSRIHVDLSAFTENFTYDEEYSITNEPTFYKIANDTNHEVFATKDQFEKWTKNK